MKFRCYRMREEKGAAPVWPALLGWRTDDLLRFLPSKLNERRFTKSAESEAGVTIISVPILKPMSNANIWWSLQQHPPIMTQGLALFGRHILV